MLPPAWRAPALFLSAAAASPVVVTVLDGAAAGRDALALPAIATGTVGVMLGGERVLRSRRRAKQRASPAGTGSWRVLAEPHGSGLDELLANDSMVGAFLMERLRLQASITPSALVLTPSRYTRRAGRLQPCTLLWSEVAELLVGKPTWQLAGRPTLGPLSPVDLMIVGDLVADLYQPVTDVEAAEDGPEAVELAAELLAATREEFGPSYQLGMMPVRLLLEDPEPFVALARRYRQGRRPALDSRAQGGST